MAKHNVGVPLPVFHRLATDPVVTLHVQIHERIRGTILSGARAAPAEDPVTAMPPPVRPAGELALARGVTANEQPMSGS